MKPHKIERIYAWVATDATGEDGIPAFERGDGTLMPMVGSDMARIESLRPIALSLAAREGYALRLVEFSQARVLEEWPGSDAPPRHR